MSHLIVPPLSSTLEIAGIIAQAVIVLLIGMAYIYKHVKAAG